ncbi:Ulp1 family isopeptidase [Mesorhizobium neociceri]|uniref:Ubiquitin-like protease family profile domain-containing protein n=1 Tax=Mesorhizobium neociceri TaxID=1307853 RepID=A0A838B8V9_9HYPH|nr:Ulp1 family isopeptidase [Mesorhizobium neociceri]MBA1142409.1 hypothetical protein [Mesorhizobium neociceri]
MQEQSWLRQQSDNVPANETGFEPQPQVHGNIQRTDMGISMRIPPQSHLRNSRLGSTRPTASSEPPPVARAKNNKGRVLWSRIKSAVAKVSSEGGRGEKSSYGSASGVVYSEIRKDFGKRACPSAGSDLHPQDERPIKRFAVAGQHEQFTAEGNNSASLNRLPQSRILLHPYPDDARIIEGLKEDSLRNLGPDSTSEQKKIVRNVASHQRKFSDWLQTKEKGSITSRLNGSDQLQRSLQADHAQFTAEGNNFASLNRLRQYVGAEPQSRILLHPYPDDAEIIHSFLTEQLSKGANRKTVTSQASHRRKFSDWLQTKEKGSITSRLSGCDQQRKLLRADYKTFSKTAGQISMSFTRLQQHLEGLRTEPKSHASLHPYPDDTRLIEDRLKDELHKLGPVSTPEQRKLVQNVASRQRKFSDWLQTKEKGSITSRLSGSDQLQRSLQADHAKFTAEGNKSAGLDRLRRYVGAEPQSRIMFHPYPDDARIIEGLKEDSLRNLGPDSTSGQKKSVQNAASHQRRFSDWLQTNNKGSIASRLNGSDRQRKLLRADYKTFSKTAGQMSMSFTRLQQYLEGLRTEPKSHASLHPYPDDTRLIEDRLKDELHKLGPVSTPEQRKLVQNVASHQRKFSDWLQTKEKGSSGSDQLQRSLQADHAQFTAEGNNSASLDRLAQYLQVVDANEALGLQELPATPSEGAWDLLRELWSSAQPDQPREMRDDAQSAPVSSPAARPTLFMAPSGAPQELEDIGYSEGFQDSFQGELYSVTWGPERPRNAQLIDHPRTSSASGAQIGALDPTSSHDGSGRVLGLTEWLSDDHINRDYELLGHDLLRNNPYLAARTRFVDPLVSQLLREGESSAAELTFGRIIGGQNGSDKADFLFLPVNNASAAGHNRHGTHWSLLLVDRRDRKRPLAYHYDSYGGLNSEPAAILAGRLNASIQDASIGQQTNPYDCGVFVLAGTRALVERLAQGREDIAHLDNLRPDRQALRSRLRTHPG